jgi:lipid-binding SYLF domain-containing protein
MIRPLGILLAAGIAAAVWPAATRADDHVGDTLRGATEVLDALKDLPAKGIPPALLRDAEGVAVFPGVIKAGLGIGGRFGRGVVIAKDKAGNWASPVFVTIAGGGIGPQAGVTSTDLVLVFKTKKGVERLLQGKDKLTLGAEAGVAAGPIGRQAEASTDAQLRAEIFSYSRSRGLFAGASFEGAAIVNDVEANRVFSRDPRREELKAAEGLINLLAAMVGPAPAAVVPVPAPAPLPGPPPVPVPAPGPPPATFPGAPPRLEPIPVPAPPPDRPS